MAAFLVDSFTGSNGAALTAHAADTSGAGWTKHPASGGTATIQSNRAGSDGSESDYYHTASPAGTDYEVQGDLVWLSSNQYAGLTLRVNVSATTWYGFGYDFGNARWEMFRGSAGSFSTLATASATFTSGSHTLRFTVSGSGATVSLVGYVDGVSTLTASDTNASRITATGKAGFYTASNGAATQGYVLDNYSATDAGGAGFTLSGAMTGGVPALAGAAVETFAASGGVAVGVPGLAGNSVETFLASGGVMAPPPTVAGVAVETFALAGGVSVPPATLAGAASEQFAATGAVSAPVPALAGFAAVGDVFVVAGGVVAGVPALAGVLAETFAVASGPAAPLPVVAGVLAEAFVGAGAAAAAVPSLSGVVHVAGASDSPPPARGPTGVELGSSGRRRARLASGRLVATVG